MPRAILVLLCLAWTACDPFGPEPCEPVAAPGLIVNLVDGGAPAVTTLAVARVRSGFFTDSARFESPTPAPVPPFSLAYNRPDTYELTVSAAGYADVTQNGVQVPGDRCNVETVTLDVQLEPVAGPQ